jgi:hypothetical protein
MSMVSRADAYQRRHRWAGLPLAVLYKFVHDQGTYLAAQITYHGFVAGKTRVVRASSNRTRCKAVPRPLRGPRWPHPCAPVGSLRAGRRISRN